MHLKSISHLLIEKQHSKLRVTKDVIPAWPESFFAIPHSFVKSIIQKDSRSAARGG
jgi:hypothetical protein